MPILNNPQQERHCQLVASGMSKTAAHHKAGYKKSHNEASRLGRKPLVRQRIAELKRAGAKLAEISHARVLQELSATSVAVRTQSINDRRIDAARAR